MRTAVNAVWSSSWALRSHCPTTRFARSTRSFALFAAVARIRPGDTGRTRSISKRELECLKLTASGSTSEEIAKLLKLSVHTASQYLTQSTQKLNAVNLQLRQVAKALRLGLIE
ncbi:response regulator transcription factor [Mesorhizobium atlanticum]